MTREGILFLHIYGRKSFDSFKFPPPFDLQLSTDSSDGNDEPPKKKQGFFSWLRRDITQDLIKPQASAEEVEAAKRVQEARGDANLFDSVGRTLQSQQRDEMSKLVGADVPEDISPEEAKRLMKKALKPKPTEVCKIHDLK